MFLRRKRLEWSSICNITTKSKMEKRCRKHGLRIEVCVGPTLNDNVIQWEIEMIRLEGTFHYDCLDGIGCNFTRGGEGMLGNHALKGKKKPTRSKEHCEAISRALAGKLPSEKQTKFLKRLHENNRGKKRKPHSAEVRKRISEKLRGRKLTPEHCQNIAHAVTHIWEQRNER